MLTLIKIKIDKVTLVVAAYAKELLSYIPKAVSQESLVTLRAALDKTTFILRWNPNPRSSSLVRMILLNHFFASQQAVRGLVL